MRSQEEGLNGDDKDRAQASAQQQDETEDSAPADELAPRDAAESLSS